MEQDGKMAQCDQENVKSEMRNGLN